MSLHESDVGQDEWYQISKKIWRMWLRFKNTLWIISPGASSSSPGSLLAPPSSLVFINFLVKKTTTAKLPSFFIVFWPFAYIKLHQNIDCSNYSFRQILLTSLTMRILRSESLLLGRRFDCDWLRLRYTPAVLTTTASSVSYLLYSCFLYVDLLQYYHILAQTNTRKGFSL